MRSTASVARCDTRLSRAHAANAIRLYYLERPPLRVCVARVGRGRRRDSGRGPYSSTRRGGGAARLAETERRIHGGRQPDGGLPGWRRRVQVDERLPVAVVIEEQRRKERVGVRDEGRVRGRVYEPAGLVPRGLGRERQDVV